MFKDFIILIGAFYDSSFYSSLILPTAVKEL